MRTVSESALSTAVGAGLIDVSQLRLPPPSTSPEALIEVRAPYYALRDARTLAPGRVEAFVSAEQSLDMEAGLLAAAEAGRHMAILGSMACATLRPSDKTRCYFLAERALLSSPQEVSLLDSTTGHARQLRVSANALSSREREGAAECTVHDGSDHLLFTLRVGYKVVPEKVFRRLFAAFRVDMRQSPRSDERDRHPEAVQRSYEFRRRNPYLKRLNLSIVALNGEQIRGELPNIPADACAGHFPLYPALPVAVLMEVFSNAGGALLRTRLANPALRYRVRNADILAAKLVFAGQSIVLEGNVLADLPGRGARVQMRATLPSGDEVSTATFDLEPTP